jgi:hypothetical protein
VHLKEFSLISPVIEAAEVFSAIQTAIPPDAIAQAVGQTDSQVVRPLATPQTPGAFLGGLRLMAVDGTVFDVPDTEANARVFGYPGSRRGTRAAFPLIAVGVAD